MIDGALIQQYASAVQARDIIAQLPQGLREHAQQYDRLLLEDIRAQANNHNLTEQEILDMVKPTLTDIIKKYLPVIADCAMVGIKKHYPAVSISSVLSALISYLVSTLQK